MTSPTFVLAVLAALTLGPKDAPSGTKGSPETPPPAAKDPPNPGKSIDPSVVPGPSNKGKPGKKPKGKKSGPDQEGLATPPAGLHFVYVTPSDLVGSSRDWQITSQGGLGVIAPMSEHSSSSGSTQLRLPRGARLRWLDCAINSVGGPRNSFNVGAVLARHRYAEHFRDPGAVRLLGSLELSNTRALAATDQGRTFGAGVAIPATADSLASDDGWFTLQIFISDTEAFSNTLRACRVGYEPA